MTRTFFQISICSLIFWSLACNSDKPDDPQLKLEAGPAADTTTISVLSSEPEDEPPPPPPPSLEKVKNMKKAEAKSPFKDLGCCGDEAKRQAEECCCQDVLQAYAKMVKEKARNLNEVKKTDPILKFCRDKYKKSFNDIDYPPGTVDEDDGL